MGTLTYRIRSCQVLLLFLVACSSEMVFAQADSTLVERPKVNLLPQDSMLSGGRAMVPHDSLRGWRQRVRLAQPDSLVLKNGNIMTGQVKLFEQGLVNMKTPYSKTDFVVKWSGVKAFYSKRPFLIEVESGQRANGTMEFDGEKNLIIIRDLDGRYLETPLSKVVYLRPLQFNFWSHVKLGADLGLSISKANRLRSLNFNTDLGYVAPAWLIDGYYSFNSTSQDSVQPTKRSEANATLKYFLKNKWFLSTSVSLLSNTEQALQLRTVSKAGANKFISRTNRTYWGVGGGLSFNNESFTNETPGRNSLEGYVGTELSRFALGNLSFLNSLFIYPSLTEAGRWRADLRIDNKYDLRGKFYVKLGFTLNYDNQPAVSGHETDYVISFSIGWKLW